VSRGVGCAGPRRHAIDAPRPNYNLAINGLYANEPPLPFPSPVNGRINAVHRPMTLHVKVRRQRKRSRRYRGWEGGRGRVPTCSERAEHAAKGDAGRGEVIEVAVLLNGEVVVQERREPRQHAVSAPAHAKVDGAEEDEKRVQEDPHDELLQGETVLLLDGLARGQLGTGDVGVVALRLGGSGSGGGGIARIGDRIFIDRSITGILGCRLDDEIAGHGEAKQHDGRDEEEERPVEAANDGVIDIEGQEESKSNDHTEDTAEEATFAEIVEVDSDLAKKKVPSDCKTM